MNVLFISLDSFRRDFLGGYRDQPVVVDYTVDTPNLDRFADRAAVFESHFAGSLPCMPARREWQTGFQEFLWRPWGPLEPFDTPVPLAARNEDVLTQLITDHFHYFQHGSHGYYENYNAFEFVRGNEYDAWKSAPRDPDEAFLDKILDVQTDHPHSKQFVNRSSYARNIRKIDDEDDFFSPQVFTRTTEWLDRNIDWEQWFLYVDSFDVHEPFHVPEPYASLYTDEDPADPDLPLWPYYGRIDEGQSALTDRQLAFVLSQFAGKVTMVDHWFGRVLDKLDELQLWDDTVVIVTSDHGFLLGDHGWIGKNHPPLYNVLARTPLFIWHPESPRMGDRISALTSAVDLYATMLDALDVPVPDEVHSRSLQPVLAGDRDDHRDWALYGYWGTSVNVTDGEHTYLHPCKPDEPAYCYSTTMMNPHSWFTPPEPKPDAETGAFLPFTDAPVWRYVAPSYMQNEDPLLFELETDPWQHDNLAGTGRPEERAMRDLLVTALDHLEAPDHQFDRLGLDAPA